MTNGNTDLKITDPKPDFVIKNLDELKGALDNSNVPKKVLDKNLVIATWNIRCFGNLTKKWVAESKDSPKRDYQSIWCIAEIIKRFDVIAIQEVRNNLRALRYLLKILGPHWSVIMTDVTKGSDGNFERLAFVFDTRKVQLSGLACELVIPPEWKKTIDDGAFVRQFARTPYAVAFRSRKETFILATLHVIWGEKTERKEELLNIAKWLAEWSEEICNWGHNLIALGDFNTDRKDDKLYQAFVSTGLIVPEELTKVPRTLSADPQNPNMKSYFDQIAWFVDQNKPFLSMEYLNSGYFDFKGIALKERNYSNTSLSWRISDHFPLWAEFSVEEKFR